MSRDHIRQLISAIQDRVRPSDDLPFPSAESPGVVPDSFDVTFDDGERTIAIPPGWKRPLPPDWIAGGTRREGDNPVELEPDDEVTIETADERGDLLPLPRGKRARPGSLPLRSVR